MAFEKLYDFVDLQVKEYKKKENSFYLIVLTEYHNTVLSHPKFKDQKAYCEKKIFEMCPSYYEGYFGKKATK